jgi:isorenieratene synthase
MTLSARFNKLIEKKLGGYRQQLLVIDKDIELNSSTKPSVAIIGAGLAGLSAATLLAERGFQVEIFEKDTFIGGKVGSWPVNFEDGFQTNVEHGFHAFFRQYYNLRRLLKKIDADQNMIPISDYLILAKDNKQYNFQSTNTIPLLNLLSMAKSGLYSFKDIFTNPKYRHLTALLKYDPQKTFERYDNQSFQSFIEQIGLSPAMRLMFTSFSRAFFAQPQLMSLAELIKSFHFYYLSNDLGLIYDVLNDDFKISLLDPWEKYLHQYQTKIYRETTIQTIEIKNNKFNFNGHSSDYLILAADIPGIKKIITGSQSLGSLKSVADNLKVSQGFAVLRLWSTKKISGDFPFFIFTDALKILDSISLYHEMEHASKEWAQKNSGGIYELHCYALPDEITDPQEIRNQLIKEFIYYFPEMKNAEIRYENLQLRRDMTAFHTGLHNTRPGVKTAVNNLYFAGDWVKLPCPAMLMEAAATSGILAANEILNAEHLQQEPVYSVPLKGIFA